MMRPPRTAALAVATAVMLLAGCTSDVPHGGGTPAPSATRQSWTRADLEAAVFAPAEADPAGAAAPVSGAIPDRISPIPAELRVTEVVAGPASTTVRFTLRGTGGAPAQVDLAAFNAARPLTDDIRDIVLIDVTGDRRLRPFVGFSVVDADVSLCGCADSPASVSARERSLSGVFPPLAAGTTAVTVQVPGFPPVADVPVSRAR